MASESISIRKTLLGEFAALLEAEDMECPHTAKALGELVVRLASYREEGVELFPRVVLVDDLDEICGLLQLSTPMVLGAGPRGVATIKEALKRCAPLAKGGWLVFLHRVGDNFEYGLVPGPTSPLALDIGESFTEEGNSPGLFIARVGNNTVEVVGASGNRWTVQLSSDREDQLSPRESVAQLAACISADCDPDCRQQVEGFARRSLLKAIDRGHGTLVAVVPADSIPDGLLRADGTLDGVTIDDLSLEQSVISYLRDRTSENHARLISASDLVEGILSADGITIMDSRASVLAYRFFIKSDEPNEVPASALSGGARRRAYNTLKEAVDGDVIRAAFFRSSDGATEFHTKEVPDAG